MSRLLGIESEDSDLHAEWRALRQGRGCVCPSSLVGEELIPGSWGVGGLPLGRFRRRCGEFRWGSGGIDRRGGGGWCFPFR